MIKINKIRISNYRSCIDTSIDLSENLSSLIGINGSGKTNILNSIALLSRSAKGGSGLFPYAFSRNKKNKDLYLNSKVEYTLAVDDKEYILLYDIWYDTDDKNNDSIKYYEMSFKLNKIGEKFKDISFEAIDNILSKKALSALFINNSNKNPFNIKRNLSDVFENCLLFLTNTSYYSATQFSSPALCPNSIEVEDDFLLSKNLYNNNYHEKFIFDLYNLNMSNHELYEIYVNTINHNGLDLISDINFTEFVLPDTSFEIKAGGKIKQIDKKRKIVVSQIKIGNTTLTPNQLSEGTFKTLALVFYILNDNHDLLLIEEPEVCVHHGLLNCILDLLIFKSKDKQIIISTHSDYVLDKLIPENVILVKKQNNEGTKAFTLNQYLKTNNYQALKNYLSDQGNLGEFWKSGGLDNE